MKYFLSKIACTVQVTCFSELFTNEGLDFLKKHQQSNLIELAVISNFYHRRPNGGSKSRPSDTERKP